MKQEFTEKSVPYSTAGPQKFALKTFFVVYGFPFLVILKAVSVVIQVCMACYHKRV
jgi:hypothetical protein